MSYINELTNIKSLCRICLTQSKNIIPLNTNLENIEKSPLIKEALEEVVGYTITCNKGYPEVICAMCQGLLKISYNLKIQFKKSEKILLQHFKNMSDPFKLNNENSESKTEDLSDETSHVEIIVGSSKYDLKDILIVEEEKSDEENFKGFLNNLGKTVTAKFVNKAKSLQKSVHEEKAILQIEKLESPTKNENVTKKLKPTLECLDQYIITQDDEQFIQNAKNNFCKANFNLEKFGLKNFTDADQDLFQSALSMQLKCNICDKMFSSKGRFKRHLESCKKVQYNVIKNESGGIFALKCHLCPRIFKQKKFLNYHEKTAHSTEPIKYKCDICGQTLRNRNVLMYHKLTKHGERKFECELCEKKFFTSNGLKTHVQSHTQRNVAQCVCPVCGKTFHYKGGLFYHMKLHTNERKYCCEFCDKKFYTLNAKKRHTLTHTGIRPYACKYCDKRFFSTGEGHKHEYLHTGVRPYSCQYCKKGFSSSYNMKVHLVSHPGPYACKFCDKTFVNMNVLKFHHRTKHSITEEVEDNLELSNTQPNQVPGSQVVLELCSV
ncbi:zinc finger protein 669-like [Anoplophora glabripennis]|uniref:zinc finger protein 669-like n=1 Tax=Anoplophora glabripennis TaxID=217634 RepID=UPI0008752310|nr:zinc finger protein 669-like [Anoplophora glabripennis]